MKNFLKKVLIWWCCVSLVGCHEEPKLPDPAGDSEQKFVIKESRDSMGLEELMQQIKAAKIGLVVDLAHNRAFTFYDGEVKDAFNVFTGAIEESSKGKKHFYSSTPTGSSSIHLADYCSKWYSAPKDGPEEAQFPCHVLNRLGRLAFWVKRFLIGFHTRHPRAPGGDLASFDDTNASDRYTTWGCVVAHYERLEQFAELMFSDPAFIVWDDKKENRIMHPGVTQIRQALVENHGDDEAEDETKDEINHRNMAIGLKGVVKKEVSEYTPGLIKPIVRLDGRMIVVNTNHRNWLSLETLFDRHPILKLLYEDKEDHDPKKPYEDHNPKKPYRVVTDCTAKEDVSIFSSGLSFTTANKISSVKKGAQLKKLYRPQGFNGPVEVKVIGSNSSSFQRGWIEGLEDFECSEDYYSSSDKAEIIDSK